MQTDFLFDKRKAAELLAKDSTFAFVLLSIILNKYTGEDDVFPQDYVEEPSLLFKALEEDFSVKLSEDNENKINAALTAMTTDLFYTNRGVFNRIAQTLNTGDPGTLEEENELDACKCMWAVVEVGLITGIPADKAGEVMSKQVIDMVNNVVDNEAEDKEAQLEDFDADELDTMDEALAENYYQKHLTANLLELAAQLLHLGVPEATVGEMLGQYERSMKASEEKVQ